MNKHIVLIRTDSIGDYILFRNFLQEIRENVLYKNCKITLVANIICKEICMLLDHKHVDKFIWINQRQFSNSRLYRFRLFFTLSFLRCDMVINTVRSSRKDFEDRWVKMIKAPRKIGNSAITDSKKGVYSSLIQVPTTFHFEFEWNKYFLSKALNVNLLSERTAIVSSAKNNTFNNYAVFFIGAREKNKIWPIDKFMSILEFTIHTLGLNVILCGDQSDEVSGKYAHSKNEKIINLAGKTSIAELIDIVSHAKFVFGNDSMGVHMAAACNVQVFCVYRGQFYGRFFPYPKNYNHSVITIVPLAISNYMNSEEHLLGQKEADVDIDSITVDQCIHVLRSFYQPLVS